LASITFCSAASRSARFAASAESHRLGGFAGLAFGLLAGGLLGGALLLLELEEPWRQRGLQRGHGLHRQALLAFRIGDQRGELGLNRRLAVIEGLVLGLAGVVGGGVGLSLSRAFRACS
jgi:hypothetical protein